MQGFSPLKRRSSDRQAAERRGRWAERVAIVALALKGYRLLTLRFKSGPGEIDLIMRKRPRGRGGERTSGTAHRRGGAHLDGARPNCRKRRVPL